MVDRNSYSHRNAQGVAFSYQLEMIERAKVEVKNQPSSDYVKNVSQPRDHQMRASGRQRSKENHPIYWEPPSKGAMRNDLVLGNHNAFSKDINQQKKQSDIALLQTGPLMSLTVPKSQVATVKSIFDPFEPEFGRKDTDLFTSSTAKVLASLNNMESSNIWSSGNGNSKEPLSGSAIVRG